MARCGRGPVLDTIRDAVLVPVHRAGRPFIAGCAVLALAGFLFSSALGVAGVLATAACALFFRDPQRLTPTRPGLVVSAADGIVTAVDEARPPLELGLPLAPVPRISVFLSVLDVHINRVPVDGTVAAVVYRPGAFVNAALDKASAENERNEVRIDTADGRSVVVVQIAGLIARRICCWVSPGLDVRAGERFGLIRFGSRVDVYLPEGAAPLVFPGQRCIGGETVLADLHSHEPARLAERR